MLVNLLSMLVLINYTVYFFPVDTIVTTTTSDKNATADVTIEYTTESAGGWPIGLIDKMLDYING